MIKVIAAVALRPDWSLEQWRTHYHEVHGPLVASVSDFTRHLQCYAQNYVLHGHLERTIPEYYSDRCGITELFYKDAHALTASYEEPEYLRIVRPDEDRFRNVNLRNWIVGTPHELSNSVEIVDDKSFVYLPRIKLFAFIGASDDADPAQFQKDWRSARQQMLREDGTFTQRVRKHVQTDRMEDPLGRVASAHALVEEFWFDNADDAEGFWLEQRIRMREAGLPAYRADDVKVLIARTHNVFGPGW